MRKILSESHFTHKFLTKTKTSQLSSPPTLVFFMVLSTLIRRFAAIWKIKKREEREESWEVFLLIRIYEQSDFLLGFYA